MSARLLLALEVASYAAIPLYFAAVRSPRRVLLLYVYVGLADTVGGLLGGVYTLQVAGSVAIPAGSVAYGAVLMTTLLLVMVANDVQVVRNVMVIIVIASIFKYVTFAITASALRSHRYANPFHTSPSLFDSSLRVVTVGGVLILVELLIALAVLELLGPRVRSTLSRSLLQVAVYVAVVTLDGVFFTVLTKTGARDLDALVGHGVEIKLILALAYAVPLLAFLLVFRSRIAAFNRAPLRLHDLFLSTREDLLARLQTQDEALVRSQARLAASLDRNESRSTAMAALAAIEGDIDQRLGQVGHVVQPDAVHPPALITLVNEAETSVRGHRINTFTTTPAERAELASNGPWIETRELGSVVCVPIVEDGAIIAVVEFGAEAEPPRRLFDRVRDIEFGIGAVLRPDVLRARTRWARRQPIESILRTRSAQAWFQPIVRLRDRTVVAYEGLIRFEEGVSPEERFREAARLGLGTELDLLAVDVLLAASHRLPPGPALSMNVSPATVLDPRLPALLAHAPRQAALEITEHDPVGDYGALVHAMRRMPHVPFGVDDAGSGYASLQHILRVRPYYVKLDRSLVANIDSDPAREALVNGLSAFVAELDAVLVAEGIQTEAEAETLVRLGVSYGQGYLFGVPRPPGTTGDATRRPLPRRPAERA